MTVQTLFIPGELPGLNEIIGSARTHWAKSAKQKKDAGLGLMLFCRKLKPVTSAEFTFTWLCKNRKRDPDNIASGKKFIFDALQDANILKNDGWDQVKGISHKFQVDARPGVIITIVEEN
jgi:Holliday junction resolvase RusA-like endonuclease